MKLLLNANINLFFVISSFVVLSFQIEIPTCCPEGYKVKKIGVGSYNCDLYNDEEKLLKNNQLSGFLIQNSTKPNIPNCENIELYSVRYSKEKSLSNNSCVTHLNDEFIVLSCPILVNEPKVQINAIKKCCSVGQSYNFYTKRCEKSDDKFVAFSSLLTHPTILENGNLICNNDQVIVQYFSVNHSFHFEDSDLIVGSDRFYAELYCLESVLKTDIVNETGLDGYEILPPEQMFMVKACHISSSICEKIPCTRRCCEHGQVLSKPNSTSRHACVPYAIDLDIKFHKVTFEHNNVTAVALQPRAFGVIHKQPCGYFQLRPDLYSDDVHYFNYENGDLYTATNLQPVNKNEYCVDYEKIGDQFKLSTFICFKKVIVVPEFYAYIIILSCIFLFMTLCVYLVVPKLMNLHGKTLVCYVFSLLVGYIILAILQLYLVDVNCYILVIIMYFCLIAAFSWLNVICIDIWWTLSSVGTARGRAKSKEWKKFLIYSAYAWGIALLCTVITFTVDYYELVTPEYLPNIGGSSCWFATGSLPHVIFFLTPAGILVIINIILFILTLHYCNKVKSELQKMQNLDKESSNLKKSFLANKDKLAVNGKLFIVMGVSWLLEIISSIFPDYKEIFYISDVFNAFQGIFIFLIFVFKWRVLEAIKHRIGISHKKRGNADTASMNTATVSLTEPKDIRLNNITSNDK